MIGYKKIIENMIDSEIRTYVEKKSGKYCWMVEDSMNLNLEDKKLGLPSFEVEYTVDYDSYTFSGYVSEFGSVRICSISFERTYLKFDDEGNPTGKTRTEHKFLHGKEMDKFTFDR